MPVNPEQLKRIHDKLQTLLKQQSSMVKENLQLKAELKTLKVQASEYENTIEVLKQQVEITKFSNTEMGDADKKVFEKRINGYIKEIDRCITMLSV